jgi:peptide/nickel transport system substrate-binding protein
MMRHSNSSGTGGPLAFLVIALAASGLLAACGSGPAGSTVTIAISGDIVALDPAAAYDFTTNPVVNEITEGLLRFSPAGQLVPNLAEKVDNPDPLTYVYTLRQGVKFSDGSPMTADDVVFSLNRTRDPKTASSLAWMFGSVKDIVKTDEKTVTVTLKQPDAQWRYTVATTAGHVVSKAFVEAHAANFGKPDGGLLGTGPFKFVSWKAGSEIVLERNADYWDKANGPFIDKAVFKIVPEGSTRVTGLKTGEIDATPLVPADQLPVVKTFDKVALQSVEAFSDDWVAFNTSRKPLSDPKVRQALITAFNLKDLHDNIIKDAGAPTRNQPVGSSLFVFARDKWEAWLAGAQDYAYDPAKAKALLAASSAPQGFKARITTDGDSLRLAIAQALQASAKEIGVDLEIEKLTNEELNTRQQSGKRDYDIILGGWGADFPDPVANIQPFLHSANIGDGGSNYAVYANKQVDALLDQAARSGDDTKRTELFIEVLNLAAADAPYIFVDHPKVTFAANKRLKGYTLSPIWYWDSLLRNAALQ